VDKEGAYDVNNMSLIEFADISAPKCPDVKTDENRVYVDWSTAEVVIDNAFGNGNDYRVDLERCTTSAEILDWIMQLHGKSWMTADLLSEFIGVLDMACDEQFGNGIQGVFCPGGASFRVGRKKG